ncbi:MAG TPA: thioredoxin domain-containing protein [Candidatus Dormibacteraeota bacterium]|nr:thioredoxin domain-containing protein [Candidatus Dormibacteraeota bacterium]
MNRLAAETSPYLRQHKDNPVDWYPWGAEAFQRAKEQDRPILLSVGYSACHWCHVMAHESFENPALAEIQNRLFVNIKVDREERPDVDSVYMSALQAQTGGGGWPMTVFLLPDGRPFYAGTYFPPTDRPGLPGFRRVMESLALAYRERRSEVVANAEGLSQALVPAPLMAAASPTGGIGQALAKAQSSLVQSADREFGGFGRAPKFPQCAALEFLLQDEIGSQRREAGQVVRRALDGMAQGGIRDQVGQGFHRYSVDQRWAVPHFEKMLYDNAQLIRLFLHAWQAQGLPRDLAMARSTADFLIADLGLASGGFAASLDADTVDGEGAFYGWTPLQLREALGPDRGELAEHLFGGPGPARTEQGGLVLRGGVEPARLADELGLGETELQSVRREMARDLANRRALRPGPGRDEKLIVGWNGLAIIALTELAVAADQVSYLEAALRCADAILNLASLDGRIHHLFDGSRARFNATLDDLAAFGLACLALHEGTGNSRWFELALSAAERVEAEYRDEEGVGWFDTPLGHDPNLTVRSRSLEDGAQPSGTSLMVELCLRLHALTGEPSWRERASAVLESLVGTAERYPSSFGALLSSLELLESGSIELALLVPPGERSHWPLLQRVRTRLLPRLVVGVGRVAPGRTEATTGPALVLGRPILNQIPTAYVCRDFSCQLPVTDAPGLDRQLEEVGAPRLEGNEVRDPRGGD